MSSHSCVACGNVATLSCEKCPKFFCDKHWGDWKKYNTLRLCASCLDKTIPCNKSIREIYSNIATKEMK